MFPAQGPNVTYCLLQNKLMIVVINKSSIERGLFLWIFGIDQEGDIVAVMQWDTRTDNREDIRIQRQRSKLRPEPKYVQLQKPSHQGLGLKLLLELWCAILHKNFSVAGIHYLVDFEGKQQSYILLVDQVQCVNIQSH